MFGKSVPPSTKSVRERELAELVDGAYNVIELDFKPETPSQVAWKKEWMTKAKRLVPGCESLYI